MFSVAHGVIVLWQGPRLQFPASSDGAKMSHEQLSTRQFNDHLIYLTTELEEPGFEPGQFRQSRHPSAMGAGSPAREPADIS